MLTCHNVMQSIQILAAIVIMLILYRGICLSVRAGGHGKPLYPS